MRIVVSGTHGSGKSTLIADFVARRTEYLTLGDPFEELDLDDGSSAASFAAQLRRRRHVCARRQGNPR